MNLPYKGKHYNHGTVVLVTKFLPLILVMTVKKYLADIYGYRPGYLFNQLSQDKIDAKIRFSKEFISTIGLVDPGLTKVL